jgi:hypothetical protein
MDAGHRQIAGMKCVQCDSNIFSVADGKFCPVCCCPLHTECFRPNSGQAGACLACGADVNSQAIHMALATKAIAQVRKTESVARSRMLFSAFAGALGTAACSIGFGIFRVLVGGSVSKLFLRLVAVVLFLAIWLAVAMLYQRKARGKTSFFTRASDNDKKN